MNTTFCLDNGTSASLQAGDNVQGHSVLEEKFYSLETFKCSLKTVFVSYHLKLAG